MAQPSDIVRYLRECYRADNRTGGILDLYARKIQHRVSVTGREEVLTGPHATIAVDEGRHTALADAAALYRRERSLLYCVWPLVGHTVVPESPFDRSQAGDDTAGGDGATRGLRLCAPLVVYPARFDADAGYPEGTLALSVERSEPRINLAALALLQEPEDSGDGIDRLIAELPSAPFQTDDLAELLGLVEELFPRIDAARLPELPNLLSARELAQARRSVPRHGPVACLPACVLALVPNSIETRGVLDELTRIADHLERPASSRSPSGDHATPLVTLLSSTTGRARTGHSGALTEGLPASLRPTSQGPRTDAPTTFDLHAEEEHLQVRIPAVLSRAQLRALHSARDSPLTHIVGPPGTGKSFTLAAITLDQVSRGQSVLLSGRTDQALAVLAKRVQSMLGDTAVILRGGRREYLRELKGHLEHLLTAGVELPEDPEGRLEELKIGIERAQRSLSRLEREIDDRCRGEIEWGRQEIAGIPEGWRGLFARLRHGLLTRSLARSEPLRLTLEDYELQLGDQQRLCAEYLQLELRRRVAATLRDFREQLVAFLKALRARQSALQGRILRQIDRRVLLEAFPVWMANFSDLHRVAPLAAGLFDLAIIDEATQADSASSLPIVHRARRLVITGDPRQLRHVSFLSRDRQGALAERFGLDEAERASFDYRSRSLLDVHADAIRDQSQVVFLDEHFRSLPGIIEFSNREFYRGALRVMTRRPDTLERRSLFLHPAAGRRDPDSGFNEREARALVEHLCDRLDRERDLPPSLRHSLGVLSPFRDQVERLRALFQEVGDLGAVERHDLLFGTPYAFQGEERDVVWISLALDPTSPSASFRYLNRPDVFNVAITRARLEQHVFTGLEVADAPRDSLLERFLVWADSHPGSGGLGAGPPLVSEGRADRFLGEVRARLESSGFRVWEAYPIAGLEIDLLFERDGRAVGVDLVGHPGFFAESFGVERYRMLRRAGLDVVPLAWSFWCRDPEGCLTSLIEAHERR